MKVLLDSHIVRAAADVVRGRCSDTDACHLADWRNGTFLNAHDSDILAACLEEERVWITYDQATVPALLRQWAAEDRDHAGVIFGDENTVSPNKPSMVANAVAALVEELLGHQTTNLVRYLRPGKSADRASDFRQVKKGVKCE